MSPAWMRAPLLGGAAGGAALPAQPPQPAQPAAPLTPLRAPLLPPRGLEPPRLGQTPMTPSGTPSSIMSMTSALVTASASMGSAPMPTAPTHPDPRLQLCPPRAPPPSATSSTAKCARLLWTGTWTQPRLFTLPSSLCGSQGRGPSTWTGVDQLLWTCLAGPFSSRLRKFDVSERQGPSDAALHQSCSCRRPRAATLPLCLCSPSSLLFPCFFAPCNRSRSGFVCLQWRIVSESLA